MVGVFFAQIAALVVASPCVTWKTTVAGSTAAGAGVGVVRTGIRPTVPSSSSGSVGYARRSGEGFSASGRGLYMLG